MATRVIDGAQNIGIEAPSQEHLPESVKAALQERPRGIDSSELLAAIARQWGGADKLAADMRTEYVNAETGSLARQKFLAMIQSLIVQNSEREQANIRRPSDMTTEEIYACASAMLAKLTRDRDGVEKAQESELDGAPEQSDLARVDQRDPR